MMLSPSNPSRATSADGFARERKLQPHDDALSQITMMKQAVAYSYSRLLATRKPHRPILSPRFLSAAPCEEVTDDGPDFFDTLGMERSYSIDLNELKSSYRQLMSKLHPDRHRNKSEEEQDDLHNQASNVTLAYRTLQNPQHRALHLLEKMGKPLNETATASLLGSDFLMEIMEIREAIDGASGQKEVKRLMDDINAHVQATTLQLADAFEHDNLDEALQLTAQLQYWTRCQETLREKPCFGCWNENKE